MLCRSTKCLLKWKKESKLKSTVKRMLRTKFTFQFAMLMVCLIEKYFTIDVILHIINILFSESERNLRKYSIIDKRICHRKTQTDEIICAQAKHFSCRILRYEN